MSGTRETVDEFGGLPKDLSGVVQAEYLTEEAMNQFRFRPRSGGAPEPWIYLGGGRDLMSDEDEELPLLISPHSIRGKWIVLEKDGNTSALELRSLQEKFPALGERLPNLLSSE